MIKDFLVDFIETQSVSPARAAKRAQEREIEELTQDVILAAQVSKANGLLMRITQLCYKQSADGELDNVDRADGNRIRIAKPWGSDGWRLYKSSRRMADILRRCLTEKAKRGPKAPLYLYDQHVRDWAINLAAYPTLGLAARYLRAEEITIAEWRRAREEVIEAAQARAKAAKKGQTTRQLASNQLGDQPVTYRQSTRQLSSNGADHLVRSGM